MKQTKTALLRRTIVFFLVAALLMPVTAAQASSQEIQPWTSLYLNSCSCSPSVKGGGRVDFCFDVSGTRILDELGVLSIDVYESVNNVDWYWVKTYSHSTYPNLLAENVSYHASSVSYYGISGRYYKAYVHFWGGINGAGDSMYLWTRVQQAC